MFCMDDQKFVAKLDYVLLCFLLQHQSKLIIFYIVLLLYCYIYSSLSLTKSLLVPCTYVSVESIDCILLSSFEFRAILLISSVKTLCLLLLNLFCILNIDLLFFISSLTLSMSILNFSRYFIFFLIWVLFKQFL